MQSFTGEEYVCPPGHFACLRGKGKIPMMEMDPEVDLLLELELVPEV